MSEFGTNRIEPLTTLADGTLKQINPFTGTEVWTVPGRGNRPLKVPVRNPKPLVDDANDHTCAFCQQRYADTPPEKSRIVRNGDEWTILRGLNFSQLYDTQPAFRRIPNLFEIVSLAYWQDNYGFELDEHTRARMSAYLAELEGRAHVDKIVDTRISASGRTKEAVTAVERAQMEQSYFAGGHDVIVGSRHFIDGATMDDELCSAGDLSVDEHRAFIRLTIDSMFNLYSRIPYARYVAVFQNWLAPAGASFEHLHKQMVAIDERGSLGGIELDLARKNPNIYNEFGANYAAYHNLIIAENDHAVMIAGFGHRYPTVSIYSKSESCMPWEHTDSEVADMSDLLHAAHAATGRLVPTNEEWHHRPMDVEVPSPWRINLKWRISTLAGFEGGTKIYVNTLSPTDVRDRVVPRLYKLRDEGRISPDTRIATECSVAPNKLNYVYSR